jgi:DNA-binding NarL/FixJ family response regulator
MPKLNGVEAAKQIRTYCSTAVIRLVHAGEAVFDLRSVGKILYLFSRDIDKRQELNSLRSRETEVIRPSAKKGMGNKEIASKLGISVRTVQTHLVSVLKKLGASLPTETVLYALREGWIALDDLPARDETL